LAAKENNFSGIRIKDTDVILSARYCDFKPCGFELGQ
jgi:hypothetical protein